MVTVNYGLLLWSVPSPTVRMRAQQCCSPSLLILNTFSVAVWLWNETERSLTSPCFSLTSLCSSSSSSLLLELLQEFWTGSVRQVNWLIRIFNSQVRLCLWDHILILLFSRAVAAQCSAARKFCEGEVFAILHQAPKIWIMGNLEFNATLVTHYRAWKCLVLVSLSKTELVEVIMGKVRVWEATVVFWYWLGLCFFPRLWSWSCGLCFCPATQSSHLDGGNELISIPGVLKASLVLVESDTSQQFKQRTKIPRPDSSTG